MAFWRASWGHFTWAQFLKTFLSTALTLSQLSFLCMKTMGLPQTEQEAVKRDGLKFFSRRHSLGLLYVRTRQYLLKADGYMGVDLGSNRLGFLNSSQNSLGSLP